MGVLIKSTVDERFKEHEDSVRTDQSLAGSGDGFGSASGGRSTGLGNATGPNQNHSTAQTIRSVQFSRVFPETKGKRTLNVCKAEARIK